MRQKYTGSTVQSPSSKFLQTSCRQFQEKIERHCSTHQTVARSTKLGCVVQFHQMSNKKLVLFWFLPQFYAIHLKFQSVSFLQYKAHWLAISRPGRMLSVSIPQSRNTVLLSWGLTFEYAVEHCEKQRFCLRNSQIWANLVLSRKFSIHFACNRQNFLGSSVKCSHSLQATGWWEFCQNQNLCAAWFCFQVLTKDPLFSNSNLEHNPCFPKE